MPLTGPPLDEPVALAEILEAGLAARPDEDAVVSLNHRWTFAALDDASDRLVGAYRALGLAPGDRIASLMPNRSALVVHYLACMRGGFVAVPLNYRYTPIEMGPALAKCGASTILYHAERQNDLDACAEARAMSLGQIEFDGDGRRPGPRFEEMLAGNPSGTRPAPPDPNAPAFIMFTSGSTGPAKGVTHTFESMRHVFGGVSAVFGLTPEDVMLPGSSMSHMGGLVFSFAALGVGARVLVARSFIPHEILPLLRKEQPTVLCMLPVALFRLIRDRHAAGETFASLRIVRAGADKVPLELQAAFAALTGIEIDEGYGSTEMGLASLNPVAGPIIAGSVGRPLPGIEISIRDESGREVPQSEDGIAWVRSRSLMSGYWEDEEATRQVMRDGWFDSGDLMRADENGYLWFRGRKKQIIVHDGSNIFPQEVEDALLAHPDVESAGVIGIHDLLHGENVRAYVVAKRGTMPDADELILFARERVGYKAPEEIEFLEAMPLNPTGKVDRVRLKAKAEERLGLAEGGG